MSWLTYVAARPDGKVLAVSSSEGWLGVWMPKENRIVATQALGDFVNKIGWTGDGGHLLATAGDDLVVLSADGSQRLATIATGHGGLRTFALHPTQPIVATTGTDGMVRLWELPSGTKRGEVLESRAGKSGGGTALALSEDAIVAGYENGYY
nr:WD40 repeat domain-containing protein [Deltaproteobacteria bacterium]